MPIPVFDPVTTDLVSVTGTVKLPGRVAPLEGTWYAEIRTTNGAAIDTDGTVRAGQEIAYDDGSGATMDLPPGSYRFRFQSSDLVGGQPVHLGWYPFDLTADTLWGDIMETPVELPVTPSDVTRAEAAADRAELAALDAQEGVVSDAGVANQITAGPETQAAFDARQAATTPEAFGAPGNNVAADTDGLRAALAFLKVVELKPGRTYVLDSPLTLVSQRLVGNGATIKRANQFSTTTSTTVTANTTATVTVASVAGFRVGQSVMLVNGSSFDTSNRVISAIDVGAKTITVSTSFGIGASGTSTLYLSFNTLTLTGGSVVEHLNIDGNKANWTFNRWQNTSEVVTVGNHNRVVGVKADNCPGEGSVVYGDHNVIRDSAFTNVNGNGVHFSGASHPVCDNVTVIAANLDTTVGHADGCIIWSNLISHATISNCYTEGGISGIGSIDSSDNSDVTITGNTIRNATTYAIEIVCPNTDPARIVITGNRIYSNADTPVTISNPASTPTVFPNQIIFTNNYLSGPAGALLLSLSRVKKATVEGNHFDLAAATTGSCLSIGECAGVNVRGNTFTGGVYGIVVSATSGGLLAGNQFFNQNLAAINCTDTGTSQLIVDNYVANDATAAASYNGILARDKHVVRGNYLELVGGRSGIYAINGAVIRDNTVRHGAATYSIRADGGSTGIRFVDNDVTVAISNAGGAGNTETNTTVIPA